MYIGTHEILLSKNFPTYFSYDDLIDWCERNKDLMFQTSYSIHGGEMFMPYEYKPNNNALVQFILDFGKFFEIQDNKQKDMNMGLTKISW